MSAAANGSQEGREVAGAKDVAFARKRLNSTEKSDSGSAWDAEDLNTN